MKIGIADVVFIVFLILKLTGAATLSWWLVFSPYLIVLGLYCLAGLCALAIYSLEKRK